MDRQTDRQTDRETDRQHRLIDQLCPVLHMLQAYRLASAPTDRTDEQHLKFSSGGIDDEVTECNFVKTFRIDSEKDC